MMTNGGWSAAFLLLLATLVAAAVAGLRLPRRLADELRETRGQTRALATLLAHAPGRHADPGTARAAASPAPAAAPVPAGAHDAFSYTISHDLRAPIRVVEGFTKILIEPGLEAQGDPTLLRVALENLLGNAWKYTAKRGDPQIWFGRDGAASTFVVRDNGAGFDMRFADRLFGVFQRLHSAGEFQATGIGLASVRRIVRHGGDIWAEAEVDRGASFHFTLG